MSLIDRKVDTSKFPTKEEFQRIMEKLKKDLAEFDRLRAVTDESLNRRMTT